jgi:hypothetical protein
MVTPEYPNPCNNCGLCCITEVCSVGQIVLGIAPDERRQKCPALEWDEPGTESRCGLLTNPERYTDNPVHIAGMKARGPEMIGSGQGCCFKGKVYMMGEPYEFADLPDHAKVIVAQRFKRDSNVGILYSKPL